LGGVGGLRIEKVCLLGGEGEKVGILEESVEFPRREVFAANTDNAIAQGFGDPTAGPPRFEFHDGSIEFELGVGNGGSIEIHSSGDRPFDSFGTSIGGCGI
jgi:hypothetical protein